MSAHTQPGRPSEPIPINTRTGRSRSASVSSGSSTSTSSSTEPPTPLSASATHPARIAIPSPGSSPILSYFLQSPTGKTPGTATFPFKRKFGTAPVFEEEEDKEREVPVAAHARRASTAVAGRFAQPQAQATPLPDPHMERGAGLLRRLSLSSAAFTKPSVGETRNAPPSPPPNTAVSPTAKTMPFSREGGTKARSATLGPGAVRPRRAPSPMGERILKGHFDGFN